MTNGRKAIALIMVGVSLFVARAVACIPRDASYLGPQLLHVDDNARKHDFSWDGAGRTKSVLMTGAEQPRAAEMIYDLAGRLVSSSYGEGRASSPSRPVRTLSGSPILRELQKVENDYGGANTELPGTSTATEDLVHRQRWSLAFDTLGQTTHAGIDGTDVSFDRRFDESGNVTSSKTPARRGTTMYDYDARSFNTAEHLPGTTNPNKYEPDANGVLKQYTDPTGEPTKITNDGIGRPVLREYFDRTTEEIHYVGPRVDWTRDRQKREQHFEYDNGGRLARVLKASGDELDHITYENGRVVSWKTPDALIEFSDFDRDNHPQQITQHRFDSNRNELDVYTIGHQWTDAGELRRTDMPSYQGMNAGPRWASRIEYTHDAAGNIETILRNGLPLMDARFRSAGRPTSRNVTLANGSTLNRAYDYDDAKGTGRMSGMRVSVGNTLSNTLIAGAVLTFEGFQRKSEQLLGISGGTRFTTWNYDDRGRVDGSVVATSDPNAVPLLGIPGATRVGLTDADFRKALERSVVRPSDKPSTITTEGAQGGHKVDTITRGANSESILYKGSRGEEVSVRTDDARYHYEFDEKEHLRSITERLIANGTQSRLIRVRYAYDGVGRIVGRRVETAPVSNNQPPLESAWTLATPDIVANQPLPAATTFVWDPVTDNLAAIFVEGASRTGTTLANGGLLRQFIHGGMGMDDPIEVVTADARLFPIFDESGAGNLQAIVDENGHLLARNLPADVYGEEQVAITAPAIDEVKLNATKDTNGNITQVAVTMHATEPLDASTIATGTRLAAVTSNGTVVRTSTAMPTQPTPYTITWTLPATEWTAFTAPGSGTTTASAISIAATSSLRSTTYGIDIPIFPATPDMQSTGTVFSTTALPFEVREPIGTITQQFTTSTTDTPFTLPTLTALGTDTSAAANGLILSPFQALPFVEPMTGLTNARARWYEPRTGSWLTPDPLGYGASGSNLYNYANSDPVNGRDPTGERAANAQDKANIAVLNARVTAYQQAWSKNRRASFTDYRYGAVPGFYARTSDVDYAYQPFDVEATTEAGYRRGLSILQNDLASFGSAVDRADDDGAIYYVPNPASRGFMTRTRADEQSARRWDIALNVGLYLTDVVPSWFAPTSLEPVIDLTAGNVTAPIPVSTIKRINAQYPPHGNTKDSGLPAEGYTLRSRRTGEVLKYGETTRGEKRYSDPHLESNGAFIQFEASGTKAEMHEWQHQKIIEYKVAHGGQRPPLNKSDY